MSITIRKLDSTSEGFGAELRALLAFEASEDAAIEQSVAQILADVKSRGDAAVLEYTNRFDRLSANSVAALELPQVQATDAGAVRIMNGNPGQVIGHAEFGTEVWVSHEGRAIGIGRYMGGEVHPSRVFVRP